MEDQFIYVDDEEVYGSIKDEDRVWYVAGGDDKGSDIDMSMSSESEESESESELQKKKIWIAALKNQEDGGLWMIYPSLDGGCYRHAHILDFSKTSIAKYNRDTGHSYEFVELVKAFVNPDFNTHLVTAIFKACKPDDPTVTSFRARTSTPSRSLLDPNLDIKVVPLHSQSHTSSTSAGSQSGLEESEEDKLKTRVELLQI